MNQKIQRIFSKYEDKKTRLTKIIEVSGTYLFTPSCMRCSKRYNTINSTRTLDVATCCNHSCASCPLHCKQVLQRWQHQTLYLLYIGLPSIFIKLLYCRLLQDNVSLFTSYGVKVYLGSIFKSYNKYYGASSSV